MAFSDQGTDLQLDLKVTVNMHSDIELEMEEAIPPEKLESIKEKIAEAVRGILSQETLIVDALPTSISVESLEWDDSGFADDLNSYKSQDDEVEIELCPNCTGVMKDALATAAQLHNDEEADDTNLLAVKQCEECAYWKCE